MSKINKQTSIRQQGEQLQLPVGNGRKLDGLLQKVKNEIDQNQQQRLWAKAGQTTNRQLYTPLKELLVCGCKFPEF